MRKLSKVISLVTSMALAVSIVPPLDNSGVVKADNNYTGWYFYAHQDDKSAVDIVYTDTTDSRNGQSLVDMERTGDTQLHQTYRMIHLDSKGRADDVDGHIKYLYTITSVSATNGFKVKRNAGKNATFRYYKNKTAKSKSKLSTTTVHNSSGGNIFKQVSNTKNQAKSKVYYAKKVDDTYEPERDSTMRCAMYTSFTVETPKTINKESVTGKITVKFKVWTNDSIKDQKTAIGYNPATEYYSHPGWSSEKTKTFKVTVSNSLTKPYGDKTNSYDFKATVRTRTKYKVTDYQKCTQYIYNKYLNLGGYTGKSYNVSGIKIARFSLQSFLNETGVQSVKFVRLKYESGSGTVQTWTDAEKMYASFNAKKSDASVHFNKDGHYVLTCKDLIDDEMFDVEWDVDGTVPEVKESNATQYSTKTTKYFGNKSDGARIVFGDYQGVKNVKGYIYGEDTSKIPRVLKTYGYANDGSEYDTSSTFVVKQTGHYKIEATDMSGNKGNVNIIYDTKPVKIVTEQKNMMSFKYTKTGDNIGDFVDGDGNVIYPSNQIPTRDGVVDIELANAILLNKVADLKIANNFGTSLSNISNSVREKFLTDVWNAVTSKVVVVSDASQAKAGMIWYYVDNMGNIVDSKGTAIEQENVPSGFTSGNADALYEVKKAVAGRYYGMMIAVEGVVVTLVDELDNRVAFMDGGQNYYTNCASGVAKILIDGDREEAEYIVPEGNKTDFPDGENIDGNAYVNAYNSFVKQGKSFMSIQGNGFGSWKAEDIPDNLGLSFLVTKSGEYEIEVIDRSGNESTAKFKVKTSVPTIEGVEGGGIYSGSVTVDFMYENPEDFDYGLLYNEYLNERTRWYDLSYTYQKVDGNNGWHDVFLYSKNTAVVPKKSFQLDFLDPELVIKQTDGNYPKRKRDKNGTYGDYVIGEKVIDNPIIKDGMMIKDSVTFKMDEDNPLSMTLDGVARDIGKVTSSAGDDGIEYGLRDNVRVKYFHPHEITVEAEGEHEVISQDTSGRSKVVHFTIDGEAPEVDFDKDTQMDGSYGDMVTGRLEDDYGLDLENCSIDVMSSEGDWIDATQYEGNELKGSYFALNFISRYDCIGDTYFSVSEDGVYTQTFRVLCTDKVGHTIQEILLLSKKLTYEDMYEGLPIQELGFSSTGIKYTVTVYGSNRETVTYTGVNVVAPDVNDDHTYKEPEYVIMDELQSDKTYKGLAVILLNGADIKVEREESKVEKAAEENGTAVTEDDLVLSVASGIYRSAKTVTANKPVTVYHTDVEGEVNCKEYEADVSFKCSDDGLYEICYDNEVTGDTDSKDITIDKTAPTLSVSNGSKYTKGKKVTVDDATTGVKSVKVNGKSVNTSSFTLNKVGDNKIVAKDYAGNTKTIRVKVKKAKKNK